MVARSFETEHEMLDWLAVPANVDALKTEYPPAEYTATVDLVNREVHVVCKPEAFIHEQQNQA